VFGKPTESEFGHLAKSFETPLVWCLEGFSSPLIGVHNYHCLPANIASFEPPNELSNCIKLSETAILSSESATAQQVISQRWHIECYLAEYILYISKALILTQMGHTSLYNIKSPMKSWQPKFTVNTTAMATPHLSSQM
jgi:hypothetical protein